MDGRWMQRRVYGADHDDPDPGPRAGHEYVDLVGGPLDGLLLEVTDIPAEDRAHGAALVTEIGRFGPGGRTCYRPDPDRPAQAWAWEGDMP
ncbi:MAG: hypothetical protein HOY69_04500 [Streptomyces sp.]|nr:hypothetical protein [Streptomyces sp.]